MGTSSKFRERDFNYKKTPEKFRKFGESTHGEGRHHAHRKGERISFATPNGRETGTVIESHKEFYIVKNGDDMIKVNRNSILYQLGTFVGGARQTVDNVRKAYEFGKQKEDERLEKYKAQYGKKRSTPVTKPKTNLKTKRRTKSKKK
jgi:hypothetical protein